MTNTSKIKKTICCNNTCKKHTNNVKTITNNNNTQQKCNKHTKQMTKTSKMTKIYVVITHAKHIQTNVIASTNNIKTCTTNTTNIYKQMTTI